MLRIKDIQTTNVLFYDPEFQETCYTFCQQRNIDSLPSLNDLSKVYVRDDSTKGFISEQTPSNRIIASSKNIFNPNILNVFAESNLLLVLDEDELTGVVHFSDYNKPIVSTYLFTLFFSYERLLRTFLISSGYQNIDMLTYFESKALKKEFYKKKVQRYKNNQSKIDNNPPFQSFYLDDLISFANHHGSNLSHDVRELRNMIMHAYQLVDMEDWNAEGFIFDFNSFKTFFNRVLVLQQDLKKIKNKNSFLSGFDSE